MPKPDITQPQEVRPDPTLEKRIRRTFTVDAFIGHGHQPLLELLVEV